METKARLINLETVLKNNSIDTIWVKDNRLLVKSKADGFDISIEFTDFDVFLWFEDIHINVHPKEFDELLYYFKLAFSGQLRLQKTIKNGKVVKFELLKKENNNWVTDLLIDTKDNKFWIKEKTIVLENDYKISTDEIQKI